MMNHAEILRLLLDSFDKVVKSAHPYTVVKDHLPSPPRGRTIVVGAGKATAAMAAAFEEVYDAPLSGLVVTRYGHLVPTKSIKIVEASHPVPDEAGRMAVEELFSLLRTATADDLVVFLMSGGGSSLLSAPVDGVAFESLQRLTEDLLVIGAPIEEINIVRKHLNKALGGGLAQAVCGAPMLTLAISDVVGDDPSVIASGATVADPSTLEDAREVLERYGVEVSDGILEALNNPLNETPKNSDPLFEASDYKLIATPRMALEAVADFWEKSGFKPLVWGDEFEGDSNECAADHVALIKTIISGDTEFTSDGEVICPCAVISGGETVVTVRGDGTGGPNTQFMLQAALLLEGEPRVYGMGCDTDGSDGSGSNAGAIIGPDTLALSEAKGIDGAALLADNDSYNFFKIVDGLVETGPTQTNVNDYRVFLILPPE